MDAQEVIHCCGVLAKCTEEPGHITRTFLSPPMREVHRLVRGWMEDAGLRVWVDAVGNIRGESDDGPHLMIGSHLDTVPHAGRYDGVLGVIIGIALAGQRIAPLEVIGFSEEEGVRFGKPFIGSRALVGTPALDAEILDAITQYGLDPSQIPLAAIDDNVRGFLEFHIEQGPVLESMELRLGVVEAIAGQSRVAVSFAGKANHAGATPMKYRRDALAAAAEWICFVEHKARGMEGLVATVGQLEVQSGAVNVIPGAVRASLDVRHADDRLRTEALGTLEFAAKSFARERNVRVVWDPRNQQPATAMDASMVAALSTAAESAGHPVHRMVSGAGHDAMILARKVPAGMLFLRSPGGISHHPHEAVLASDVDAALAVGTRFLETWLLKTWRPS
jgi:allantoate deiminase